MDNYYSSVPLFLSLLKDGHVCTGTVRNNRTGLPRDLLEMKLQKYEFAWRASVPHIAVTSWIDSCPVLLLSTAVPPDQTALLVTGTAKAAARRDGTEPQAIEVPKVVQTYRELMGAVDRHDQVCFMFFITLPHHMFCSTLQITTLMDIDAYVYVLACVVNLYCIYTIYSGG
jgi:hypothetical protein